MLRIIKIVLIPLRYIWILGLLLGLGVSAGFVRIPGASATENIGCQKDEQAEGCEVYHDDNFCINGEETETSSDNEQGESQDIVCVEKEVEEESKTHTLGATTEMSDTEKQVLGTEDGSAGK